MKLPKIGLYALGVGLLGVVATCFAATTTRLNMTKPDLHSSNWGSTLNTNFDTLDARCAIQSLPNTFTSSQTFTNSGGVLLSGPIVVASITTSGYTLPLTAGAAGQCVTTNGASQWSYGTCGSGGGGGTPGGSNTQIQYNNQTGFAGSNNFQFSGSSVTLTGALATSSITLSGAMFEGAGIGIGGTLFLHNNINTFLGDNSGTQNLFNTGTNNTALGSGAFHNASAGGVTANNTSVGTFSLNGQGTYSNNVSVGDSSFANSIKGFSDNTGVGSSVLNALAGSLSTFGDSNRNVGVGSQAGKSMTSASSNTLVGYGAYYGPDLSTSATVGAGNTFIGYEAGVSTSATINNAIAIGYGATVTSSNTAQIGGVTNSINAVNLLVSSISTSLLTVNGPGAGTMRLTEASSQTVAGVGSGVDVLWGDSQLHTLAFNPNNTSTYTVVGASASVTVGQCAYWSGAGQVGSTPCGGSASAGGSKGSVQFNNGGVIAGDTNFIVTPTSFTYGNQAVINWRVGDDISNDSVDDDLVVIMRTGSSRLNLQTINDSLTTPNIVFTAASGYPRTFALGYQGVSGVNLFTNNLNHDVSVAATPINNNGRLLFGVGQASATVMIDSNTHVNFEGNNTPTVSACGTNPSISALSRDNAGVITTGSGSPTSCTLTFRNQFLNPPVCVISDNLTSTTPDISSISKTAVTFSFSAALNSGQIYYICIGND